MMPKQTVQVRELTAEELAAPAAAPKLPDPNRATCGHEWDATGASHPTSSHVCGKKPGHLEDHACRACYPGEPVQTEHQDFWQRYQPRVTSVRATRFDPNVAWPEGVDPMPCFCFDLAQDGRRCPNHPAKIGMVRMETGTVKVYPGDWVIVMENPESGRYHTAVHSDADFMARFVLPNKPRSEKA